uniref:Coronin n=1 Tax=Lepeophtheirus salmonis TaxID=72036 RepID=A0A0K2SZ79_LEPSM
MAWRFKASKYKNAAPIVPKFEQHIRDLSIGSYRSHGNFIAASAAFMAFNWDAHGSSLAVLPLEAKGRVNKTNIPVIHAHSDMVTDFKFSPFDDGLLATGSQDLTIKLWRIPESGLTSNLSNPELTLPLQPKRVETVEFHPAADNVLCTSSGTSLTIWDLIEAKDLYSFCNHEDEVQSVAWRNGSGRLLASQCKDKKLRILDPRQGSVAAICNSHEGLKDSKVVWIGDSDRLFTSGFSGDRLREITIRDMRNLETPVKNMGLDMSSGILVPLFDPDTNMCFLSGKGDRNIQFIELTDREPYIVEGLKYSGDQTKGACLVPKRAMNVMQGEVNRILQLCDSSIVPIMWQVPRKTYRDYHADIYPETNGLEASMSSGNWWSQNCDTPPSKIDLNPKSRLKENLVIFQETPLGQRELIKSVKSSNGKHSNGSSSVNGKKSKDDDDAFVKPSMVGIGNPRLVTRSASTACDSKKFSSSFVKPNIMSKPEFVPVSSSQAQISEDSSNDSNEGLAVLRRQPSIRDRKKLFEENIRKSLSDTKETVETDGTSTGSTTPSPTNSISPSEMKTIDENKENKLRNQSSIELRSKNPDQKVPRPMSKVFGRISKFKHLKGESLHKSKHFENLKNLSKTVPAECNMVHANRKRIVLPISGPGGKLAVFEISKSGRIPDGVLPVLINKSNVMDFMWDPFDDNHLVAACDDGYLRHWKIPDSGLKQPINEPDLCFQTHNDKVQIVKFHPLAKDIVLTACFNRSVRVWDLNDMSEPKFELKGHEDQLFSAEWSPCGKFVATLCKDKKIRIYEPRQSLLPIIEGGEVTPKKGARVVWVLNGQYLIITGFSRQSEQQVSVYKVDDLAQVNSVILAVSPSVLIPYYDEDSNTLFLTGRGESTVTTFEVAHDAPHLFGLSPYRPSGLHQGFAFLPKITCNVKEVEFAKAFRLTNNTIEPISFSVPRVKTAYFQDDLFPPTRILWEHTMSADEWLRGVKKDTPRISLKPDDMKCLSEANQGSDTSVTNGVNGSAKHNIRNSLPKLEQIKERSVINPSDLSATIAKIIPKMDDVLEQDLMEGVDPSEWDE